MAPINAALAAGLVGVASASYNCPGSGSLVHAWMEVTATAHASCADVQAEIEARANAEGGWKDPHNGGIYSVLASDASVIKTQRTTNPAKSVGGKLYTDKQNFELTDVDGGCQIKACSESQGFSVGDFSTNYCDIRNLYCGSADGCTPVHHDFRSDENAHTGSLGSGHDSSKCIVKSETSPVHATVAVADGYSCPGSGSFVHASMEVTATASASCADVKAEIKARANAQGGWKDPHNGGIYSVLDSDEDGVIKTQRTTNPKTSVGGKVYTDKQNFVLKDKGGSCEILACSESQGTSVADMSTNYCDIRNLYCGSNDGCTTVAHDFVSNEESHSGSLGAGHDASKCIVKAQGVITV